MSDWHVLNLGDALLAEPELAELRERFEQTRHRHAIPDDTTLHIRHVSDGRLHCEVRIYFPPAAAALAEEFGAEPCEPPEP